MATEYEVDRMVVRLTGDQSAYQKMLASIEKQTEEAASWAQKMGTKITDSFNTAFRTAQNALSSVASTSQKGGIALTGLGAAVTAPLGKATLDFAEYGKGIQTIVRQTDDAAKSAASLKKELKETSVAFKELSKVVELTEKQAAVYKLMSDRTGLSLKTLTETIKENTEEYKKWEKEADRFGLILTKEQVKAATDLAESWQRVKESLRGLWTQIGSAVFKGFKDWNDVIVGAITRATDWVKKNKDLIRTIADVAEKLVAVGTILTGIGTALATVSTFLAPIAAMVAAGAAAWLAWDTATGKFLRGEAVRTWKEYSDSVKSAYTTVMSYGKSIIDFTDKIVSGSFDAIKAGNLELAVKILWSGAKVAWIKSLQEIDELTKHKFSGVFQNLATGDFEDAWKSIGNSIKLTFLEIEKAADPLLVKMEESFVKVASVIKNAWNNIYFFIIDIVQKLMLKLGEFLEKVGTSSLVKLASPEMATGARELGLSLRESRTKMLESVLEPDTSADQARKEYDRAKKELEDKKAELAKAKEDAEKARKLSEAKTRAATSTFMGYEPEWVSGTRSEWQQRRAQRRSQLSGATSGLPRLDISGGLGRLGKSILGTGDRLGGGKPSESGLRLDISGGFGRLTETAIKAPFEIAKPVVNMATDVTGITSYGSREEAQKAAKEAEKAVSAKEKEIEKLEEQYSEANLKKRIAESKEARSRGISEDETGKLLNIRADAEERVAKYNEQITKLKKEQEDLAKKAKDRANESLKTQQDILNTQLKQAEAEKDKAEKERAVAEETAKKAEAVRRAQEEATRIAKEKEAIEEQFKDPTKKYIEQLEKLNKLFKEGDREGRAYKESVKAIQREFLNAKFNVEIHFGSTGLDAVVGNTKEWLDIVQNGMNALRTEEYLKEANKQIAEEKAAKDKKVEKETVAKVDGEVKEAAKAAEAEKVEAELKPQEMVEVTPESVAANAAAEEALDQANTAMEEVPRSRPREPVMSIFGETAYEAAQAAETESEKARKTKKETAAREEELRDRGGRKKEGLTPEQERGFENFDVRKFLKFLQELPKLPKQEPLKQEFLKQELPIFDKTTKAAEAGKDKATEETKKAEATVNRDDSKSQEPPKAAPKSVAADTAEEALDQANTTMQRAPRSRQSGEELAQKRAERDTRKRQSEEELAQKRIARDARKQAEKDWSKIVMAQKRAARNVRKQVEKDKLATAIKKRDHGWAFWEEGADSPIRPLSRTQQENMSWIKRQRGEQVSEKMNRPSAVEPPEKPVATEEDKKSLDRLDKIALNTAKLADRPIIQLEPLGVQ